MSAASDLIERAERESGQRIDDPDSGALLIPLGALSRELGQHNFSEKDDFAVGVLLREEIERGEERRRQDEMLRFFLLAGLSPDDIAALNGGKQ